MYSGQLKPAQWGLAILIMPKLGRCLCRGAPVLLHEPLRPLSSLPVFAGWYRELLGITAITWGKAVMAAQAGSFLVQTSVETG